MGITATQREFLKSYLPDILHGENSDLRYVLRVILEYTDQMVEEALREVF